MVSEKQKWQRTFSSPLVMFLLAVWLVSSVLLYRTWKDGAPFPIGMAMPF